MSASSQISSAESKATQPQARREQEILRAASKTFAARGFRNTDVQEIADLVGVGKGTIYRAFPSKEALFFAAVDHGMQLLNEAMADRGDEESSPSSRLQQKIFTFLSFFEAHEELIELLIQERSEFRDRQSHSYTRNWLSNSERWRARIQTSIDEGRFWPCLSTASSMCSTICSTARFLRTISPSESVICKQQPSSSLTSSCMEF